jgi:hypothetical protein
LQLKPQELPSQLALAFAGVGQGSQRSPQLPTLRLSLHSSSHLWKPPRQLKTQALFSHLTWALAGARHGAQLAPQKLTSSTGTHMPLQSRCPEGQTPLQAWLVGMQAPAHSFVPWGHSAPHRVPSQVAFPPMGTGQGVHELPQLLGLESVLQLSSQR